MGWQHNYGDTDPKRKNRFRDSAETFTIKGAPVDEDEFIMGAGFDMAIGADMTLSLSYQGSYGTEASSQNVEARFSLPF